MGFWDGDLIDSLGGFQLMKLMGQMRNETHPIHRDGDSLGGFQFMKFMGQMRNETLIQNTVVNWMVSMRLSTKQLRMLRT